MRAPPNQERRTGMQMPGLAVVLVIGLAFSLSLIVAPPARAQGSGQASYSAAKAALKDKKYTEAIPLYRRALFLGGLSDRDTATAYRNLAWLAFFADRDAWAAIPPMEIADRMFDGKDAQTSKLLATLYYFAGKFADAAHVLERGATDTARKHADLARVAFAGGDRAGAVAHAARAAELGEKGLSFQVLRYVIDANWGPVDGAVGKGPAELRALRLARAGKALNAWAQGVSLTERQRLVVDVLLGRADVDAALVAARESKKTRARLLFAIAERLALDGRGTQARAVLQGATHEDFGIRYFAVLLHTELQRLSGYAWTLSHLEDEFELGEQELRIAEDVITNDDHLANRMLAETLYQQAVADMQRFLDLDSSPEGTPKRLGELLRGALFRVRAATEIYEDEPRYWLLLGQVAYYLRDDPVYLSIGLDAFWRLADLDPPKDFATVARFSEMIALAGPPKKAVDAYLYLLNKFRSETLTYLMGDLVTACVTARIPRYCADEIDKASLFMFDRESSARMLVAMALLERAGGMTDLALKHLNQASEKTGDTAMTDRIETYRKWWSQ